ncbi:MAG: hypothetical protein C0467_23850 [Planctomycetaceae bacterium]|nr:hypothetical protein [Planctomycetaceae bacterium]
MLQSFFIIGMRAPARHITFRRAVVLHILLIACLGWGAANSDTPERLSAVGQVALVLGIVEGASLVGWRLAQLPKSQALEFLLVSPIRPPRVFLAEALVGIGRFALVSLSGLPVLLVMVLQGVIIPADLWPLGLMPFEWGVVAALGLTVWAYEPLSIRRVGEVIAMIGVLFYLIVGILAGEKLQMWITGLPPAIGEWVYVVIMRMFQENPFGVVRNWFILREGPETQWPPFITVNVIGAAMAVAFGLRAAFRLKGHFHDRHYKPLETNRQDQSALIGNRPLSWWAVRRVMEYSGRVNVYLAGGFCLLYSAFIVAGDDWPSWMGRAPFLIFEMWGGPAMVAGSMCVLAAVPAAFQFGLWDPTVSDRCKRLELLLLTDLTGNDYWHASLAAAWKRGRSYLWIAALLWIALAVSGRAQWYQAVAAALGGIALWGFSFAVGFRAFSTGNQAGGIATGLTLGMPMLVFALLRAKLDDLAAFVPTAACYLPVRNGISWSWAAGFVLMLLTTWWLTRRGLARCDSSLRLWFDANQGRKAE